MKPLKRSARVSSVSLSPKHSFSKVVVQSICLLAGLGVEGDAHCGALVKHRYHVKKDPTQPNRTQIHLIQSELFNDLAAKGFTVNPGDLGENVTTEGLDLLSLPTGALLFIGDHAVVEVTGLRNPCLQLNKFRSGLMPAVIEKNSEGKVMMKAGIMGIVRVGGVVSPGDTIRVEMPPQPWCPLMCV